MATFIPEFAKHGKGDITIRHLLTHESGLRPDLDLADPWTGADTAIQLAADEVPIAAPDERFIYSDINFELLGEIVRRVSGMRLDEFARREIFEPLGMRDTMFLPPAASGRASRRPSAARRSAGRARCPARNAARRRPRPDGAADGRRRRARGPVQHGRRPGDLLPDAHRRRAVAGPGEGGRACASSRS